MIAEPGSMPDRRPSTGLTLNLSSNNPFRNRAGSPAIPSPALHTPTSADSRPMSRNPFLSTFEAEFNKEASKDLIDMSATLKDSPKKATFGNTAEELFSNLTLDDANKRGPPARGPPPRSGTLPVEPRHRPSRSEEERRLRNGSAPRGPPRPRGPPGSRPPHPSSPERRENRRPRRNSESSVIDRTRSSLDDERRRRERRKEREERHKDGKSRSGKVRRPQGLDLIDKLDVTGIYGPSMIHHDGPYDAVQPHRNRRKDHRAPMEAFPIGSANNALGGSGPVNKNIDLETFHGRGAEGFTDFSGASDKTHIKRPEMDARTASFDPKNSVSFDPKGRADVIHGDESYGLGTSTFLEGAPASRAAIQRRESENQQAIANGDLGRKKSIAQRIRGISQPRRGFGEGNPRITSPEARYGNSMRTPGTPPGQPQSAGGIAKQNESNPFFNEYDDAYERKGATINTRPADTDNNLKSPSSPNRNPLHRAMTADSYEAPESKQSTGGGFLNRVKSLKGGRRPRPERPS